MPYTKTLAQIEIAQLVAQFRQDQAALTNAEEAMIENNFVRPLFRLLNWNVDNFGLSEPQWEFVLQRTTREGSRPDYVLQLDGQHLFVMDAKKVKYDMHDPRWLNQVYAYAYSTQNNAPSKKIDFAILTDFQEFVVLDCTLLAHKPEVIKNFRVIDWQYSDYVAHFDELWELFERNNVLAASRERKTGIWARYLSPNKVQANRIPPDKAFLAALDDAQDGWRVRLAKNMKSHDKTLDGNMLTAAVQLLIDRLIFVKVLSDREIERDYLTQMAQIVERDGLADDDHGWFAACQNLFAELNGMYNGSIFAPRQELEQVIVNNSVVRGILNDLLPENSPYNFAVLPVEILGTIYERFLGRVVHATDARVKIEDKPEVRKAGGVYYTPQYIVDYIVKNTVGKLLADCQTPADVAALKILDPACGSGSFLLGAYETLIEWHRNYYTGRDVVYNVSTNRDRDAYYVDEDGRVRLTAKLKRQILLNNLFGVDIDPQAVEVTRLSLSLKALEDTRSDEAHNERTLFNQTLLPDLSNNIKCGNSLISTDYLVTSDEELRRVKPFDWATEFPEIFNREGAKGAKKDKETKQIRETQGFDAVIGNPPYVLGRETFETSVKQYLSHFASFGGKYDLYIYFTERAISLLRQQGFLGYIIPNTILTNENATHLRQLILAQTRIETLRTFERKVFDDAQVESVVMVLEKETNNVDNKIRIEGEKDTIVPQKLFLENPDFRFNVRMDGLANALLNKITEQSIRLGSISDICIGIQLGGSSGNDKKESFLERSRKDKTFKQVLDGKNISRYQTDWGGVFVRYGNWLHRKRDEKYFVNPKLMLRQIGATPLVTYDENQFYTLNTIYNLIGTSNYSLKYLLGIINSKLGKWFWLTNNSDFKALFPKIKKSQIEIIPIRTINFADAADKARHDTMVKLVEQMLDLHKRRAAAKTETDQELYQRQIAVTDQQIDTLVYELYDLTTEEIAIVEKR